MRVMVAECLMPQALVFGSYAHRLETTAFYTTHNGNFLRKTMLWVQHVA